MCTSAPKSPSPPQPPPPVEPAPKRTDETVKKSKQRQLNVAALAQNRRANFLEGEILGDAPNTAKRRVLGS